MPHVASCKIKLTFLLHTLFLSMNYNLYFIGKSTTKLKYWMMCVMGYLLLTPSILTVYAAFNIPCTQRPSAYSDHFFMEPRVVTLDRFDCTGLIVLSFFHLFYFVFWYFKTSLLNVILQCHNDCEQSISNPI